MFFSHFFIDLKYFGSPPGLSWCQLNHITPPALKGVGKQSRLFFPLFHFAGSSNVNHCLACSQASVMLIDIHLFFNSVFIFVDNAINLFTYKKRAFYRSFSSSFFVESSTFQNSFFCELAKKFFSNFFGSSHFFFCSVLISERHLQKSEQATLKCSKFFLYRRQKQVENRPIHH